MKSVSQLVIYNIGQGTYIRDEDISVLYDARNGNYSSFNLYMKINSI